MNRWNAWRSSLALASLCFAIVGCGGGDIPDPDSDPNAVTELPGASAPAPAEAPPPAAAEPAAPGDPAVAPTATATPPAAETAPPAAPAEVAATPSAPSASAETEAAAEPSKAKNSSATAEMLALGNKPLPAEATAPTTAATTNPADPAAAMAPGMAPGLAAPPGVPGPTSETAPGIAAAPGVPPADPAAGAPGSEMPGYPGAGDGGAGDGQNGPADFHSPVGAVNAFLKALKAKSTEQLAEATARRAPTEASGPKNQKLFQSILDYSLSEDDLSDLANKLEGFAIVGNNVPKSTGKFTLILGKAGQNGEYYRRTITTRHEKDGWKVSDISGLGKVEKPIMMRRGVRRR